jgi:hypothetical protein
MPGFLLYHSQGSAGREEPVISNVLVLPIFVAKLKTPPDSQTALIN